MSESAEDKREKASKKIIREKELAVHVNHETKRTEAEQKKNPSQS